MSPTPTKGKTQATSPSRKRNPRLFNNGAREEAEQLRQYAAQLQTRVAQLEYTLNQTGAGEVQRIRDAQTAAAAEYQQYAAWAAGQRTALDRHLAETRAAADRAQAEMQAEMQAAQAQIVDAHAVAGLQEYGLYDFPNPAEASVELAGQLEWTRAQIKAAVRDKTAVTASTTFHFNGSVAQGRTFLNDMSKMMLRAYNAEAENAVLTMKAGNLAAANKRVERARDQAERLGRMIDLHIDERYHALRMYELNLAAQHLQAKQAAKEAERDERARLREERRAQQELDAERKRLEKERQHYANTVDALRAQGRFEELTELQDKLDDIDRGIADVDYRAANARAGYVYVISNVGAFGERMVKIGMTRRLDPTDRVRELGDASVPFTFDVHALFFSADAVGVETALHRRFAHRRVNRVNPRREFFYATPEEVRAALAEIDGSLLEFRVEPDAEQFRESQAIAAQEATGNVTRSAQ